MTRGFPENSRGSVYNCKRPQGVFTHVFRAKRISLHQPAKGESMTRTIKKTAAVALSCWGLGMGQPILKTGNCPNLTRYTAPAGENWAQFPIQPNPQSSFPTGSIQNPLQPQQSINCAQVPAGLRAEIVASELTPAAGSSVGPLAYLMYFTFDERGRVWAVDARDYPNTIASDRLRGGLGRIVILEDVDGDGALDHFKEFYSGLVIPTSLELPGNGVVVTAAPNLYYFTNNGDTAGPAQTLFTGMGSTGNYDTQ